MAIAKNRFLVVKTKRTLEQVLKDDRTIGFIQPSPHYFFYKFEAQNSDEDIKVFRGRPLSMPAALARLPNKETERSIGILIYSADGRITTEMFESVSKTISDLVFEFGMNDDWDIVTAEIDTDSIVDTAKLTGLVAKQKNSFSTTWQYQ